MEHAVPGGRAIGTRVEFKFRKGGSRLEKRVSVGTSRDGNKDQSVVKSASQEDPNALQELLKFHDRGYIHCTEPTRTSLGENPEPVQIRKHPVRPI
jgi:hypothetical protein